MVALTLARPEDRREQLAALGLTEQILLDAVQAGEGARGRATPNDPVTAAGTLDNFARIRTLRETLFGFGWDRMDYRGSPLVVNPDRTIAIGVVLGDPRTGVPGLPEPKTVREQGKAKGELISRNQEVIGLFPLPAPPLAPGEAYLDEGELAGLQTWLLMTFRWVAKRGGRTQVRSELSLPRSIGPRGRVDDWHTRILLSPLEWEIMVDYPGEQPPDIDIPLERR